MKNIIEVLYAFDEPLIFTQMINNEMHLLVKSDETSNSNTYITKRTDDFVINALKSGSLSVLGGLLFGGDVLSYITMNSFGDIISIEEAHIDTIPKEYLPTSGTPLYYYMSTAPDILEN